MRPLMLQVRLLALIVILIKCMRLVGGFNNGCHVSKIEIPRLPVTSRVIYKFACYSFQAVNPILPLANMSMPSEFNEISLSPNYFDSIPLNQLCFFTNAFVLNMSSNTMASLKNAFVDLKCLTNLNTIDFSYNRIQTPILASDFDDGLAAKLMYINLNGNLIPHIETSVFIKSDGTSRFPNLIYLGLANNLLKTLDLLWPLSIPSQVLQINMKNNPIDSLVNELGRPFNDDWFRYSMTGTRYLDATTNSLQTISDSNLLQYGMRSSYDFQHFLNKISNYDLRQSNLIPTIYCYCPQDGLYTNTWFQAFSSFANPSGPIFKLYCANLNNVNIFGFPCPLTKSQIPALFTTPPTTTTITTTTTTTTTTTVKTTPQKKAAQVEVPTSDSSKLEESFGTDLSSRYEMNLLYFLFLLVPVSVMIVFMCMCCCCGRCCQSMTYHNCGCTLCFCLRPDYGEEAESSGKVYDATLCYSEFDETWLDEEFMPQISRFSRGYKLHKLSLYHRSFKPLSKEKENILRSSKRIILMFTRRFIDEEWNNKYFRDLLRKICNRDPFCVLVAINVNVPDYRIRMLLNDLQVADSYMRASVGHRKPPFTIQEYDEAPAVRAPKLSCFQRFLSRIKYSLYLRDIEVLKYNDREFWRKLLYIMPHAKYDDTKPTIVTDSVEIRNQTSAFKLPKIPVTKPLRNTSSSHQSGESEGGNSSSSLDLRISTHSVAKPSLKKKFKRLKPTARIDSDSQNNSDAPLDKGKSSSANSTSSAKSFVKNVRSIRHIIVTIPDYMRTQLGFSRKKTPKVEKPANEYNTNYNKMATTVPGSMNYTNEASKGSTSVYLDGASQVNYNSYQQVYLEQATHQKTFNKGSEISTSAVNFQQPPYNPEHVKIPNYNYHRSYDISNNDLLENPVNQPSSQYSMMKNYILTETDLHSVGNRYRSDTPEILASFAPLPPPSQSYRHIKDPHPLKSSLQKQSNQKKPSSKSGRLTFVEEDSK